MIMSEVVRFGSIKFTELTVYIDRQAWAINIDPDQTPQNVSCVIDSPVLNANSVDSDLTPSSVVSELSLHR